MSSIVWQRRVEREKPPIIPLMSTLGVASPLPECLQLATKLPKFTNLTFFAKLPKFAVITKFPTGAEMNVLDIFTLINLVKTAGMLSLVLLCMLRWHKLEVLHQAYLGTTPST
jgi:hypothetical protein